MPDPGFTRPDLCSIRAAAGRAELAGAARGGLSADGHPQAAITRPHPWRAASTAPSGRDRTGGSGASGV